MHPAARSLIVALFVLGTGLPALAQTGVAPAGGSSTPRWELEMYGGVSLGRLSSGGSLELPGPGTPIPTSSPTFPSWRVPTWFLGDGAAFLNRVAEQLAVGARVSPLDPALGPGAASDAGHFAFGARVRHPLRGRFSFEGGMDVRLGSGGVTQELADAAAAARDSFQTTLGQILATGPFAGISVSATESVRDGSAVEIALTGALVTDFAPWGAFTPFVVTGGGVHRTLSPRWGLRLDARVLLGPRTTRVALDATPAVAISTPARFIETFTYPNLQLSNNPTTGRESTLSGTLDGFDAFTGGWQTRFRLTAGLVVRF